jgi:hypothetical protein
MNRLYGSEQRAQTPSKKALAKKKLLAKKALAKTTPTKTWRRSP